jgi:hypothetical protein
MRTWKVSYRDRRDARARRPFFKRVAYVRAASRAEAIAKVRARFPPPHSGQYRASPREQAPESFWD